MRPKTIIAIIIAIIVGIGILLKYSQPTEIPVPPWQWEDPTLIVKSNVGTLLKLSFERNRFLGVTLGCETCGTVDLPGRWEGKTFIVDYENNKNIYKFHIGTVNVYWSENDIPIKESTLKIYNNYGKYPRN